MRLKTLVLFGFAAAVAANLSAAPVLLISLDGLRPDYVTHAGEHGLKIPNLRRLVLEGSHAEGVTGVLPTVTYPSHTTMVTGAAPARHGIVSNTPFDPLGKNHGGWYWYARDIRVPTLWEAATQAGLKTASVNWPVTVGARGVRYLVPEYWRAGTADDLLLIEALSRPEGWLQGLENRLGPFPNAAEGTIAADETRTRYAVELLKTVKPGLMTVHLGSLDEAEHETGPFSPHSCETLEALDGMVGRLVAAATASQPNAVIAVVSDHGFLPTDHHVNLMVAFGDAGFVHLTGPGGFVSSWDAVPWNSGGVAAIMLRNRADTSIRESVGNMLRKLAASPENGIARVLGPKEIASLGGYPEAAFVVEFRPGCQSGDATSGPLVTPALSTGAHGYLPDRPEMRASFFIAGAHIAKAKDLGVIDMRQIAPTVAAILGVPFPSATQPKLDLIKP